MSGLKVTICAGSKKQIKEISENYFSIGRARENQITVIHSGISRKHVEVELEGYEIKITDTGSTNGTTVDGEKIPAKQPYTYKTGQEIVLGTCPATMIIELIGEEVEEEPEEQNMAAGDGSSLYCNWNDFKDFPEEILAEEQTSSAIKVEMDVPGGGQMFDFEGGEAAKDTKLNLEVSLGQGNDAFIEVKGQCTVGSDEKVDFRVEDDSIEAYHATFFQQKEIIVMVLHVAKGTYKRKRLKQEIKYVLTKGLVLHLGELTVKVVEGKTLLLKKVNAKGMSALLKEIKPDDDNYKVATSGFDEDEDDNLPLLEKLRRLPMSFFHYATFDIFKSRFDAYEDEDEDEDEVESTKTIDEEEEDDEELEVTIGDKLKATFKDIFHKMTLGVFTPSKVDDEEEEEDQEEDEDNLDEMKVEKKEADEDDDEEDEEEQTVGFFDRLKVTFVAIFTLGLIGKKKKKKDSDDELEEEEVSSIEDDKESKDDDEDIEQDDDEFYEKEPFLKRIKSLFKKSDKKRNNNNKDEDDEESRPKKVEIVAGVVPRVFGIVYDVGVTLLFSKAIGQIDLGVKGALEGVDSRLANYSDLIIIFICLQLFGTIIFGVTFGQLMMSLGQKTQKRSLGVVRLLVGYLLLPFIIVDIVLIKKRPSLKEKISGSRVIVVSSVRSIIGFLLFVPLLLFGNLLIPLYQNKDALKSEQVVRLGKIEYPAQTEVQENQSISFGFKANSSLESLNIISYPFIEKKEAKLYLLDLNSFNYFEITRKKGLNLHEIIPQLGKGNPLLFKDFPNLTKIIKQGFEKDYEFSSQELHEFVQFVKASMELSLESLQPHVLKYGPFIDSFLTLRQSIMAVLGTELPTVIDLVTLREDSYLRLTLVRDKENVTEEFISLTRLVGLSFRIKTEKNPKAIQMQKMIYEHFLYSLVWMEPKEIVNDYSAIKWNRFALQDFMVKYKIIPQDRRDGIIEYILSDLKTIIDNRQMESIANREFFKAFFGRRIDGFVKWLTIDEKDPILSEFEGLKERL